MSKSLASFIICVLLLLPVAYAPAAANAPLTTSPRQNLSGQVAGLPLYFEANRGQANDQVRFVTRSSGYILYLAADQAVFMLRQGASEPLDRLEQVRAEPEDVLFQPLAMTPVGGNPTPQVIGENRLPGTSHYFIGSDPATWVTDVPHYAQVRYADVYPGIDLLYHGLQYDFILAPGADVNRIRLAFEPVEQIEVNGNGDLLLHFSGGTLRQSAPTAYQESGGESVTVSSRFVLVDDGQVAFEVGDYDPTQALVIDPTLAYSSFLGGSGTDRGFGVAVDATGAAYVTGETPSGDFPTRNAYQPVLGGTDAFITKVSPDGGTLVYSTYLGGSSSEIGWGIEVDASGSVYAFGRSYSDDFPLRSAYQMARAGGSDFYLTRLNPAGNGLVYSTLLGGSDYDWNGFEVAIDAYGCAYLVGETDSVDFPTRNAYQTDLPGQDVVVAKLDTTRSGDASLIYSTYLGGSGSERGHSIDVDAAGYAYISGSTYSSNFPVQNAFQAIYAGGGDTFVAKLTPDGSALVYSSYLGGAASFEYGSDITSTSEGQAYVTGHTLSADFPTRNAYQTAVHGTDAILVLFDTTQAGDTSLVFSTRFGGSGVETAHGVGLGPDGAIYIAGDTSSADLPLRDLYQDNQPYDDVYVACFTPDGGDLIYSTYLGGNWTDHSYGMAVDASSAAYVTGITLSEDFPLRTPFQPVLMSYYGDAFVSKFVPGAVGSVEFTHPGGGTVAEDAGAYTAELTLTVIGTGTLSSPVTVDVTLSGDATPGTDYTPAGPTLPITFVNAGGFPAGIYTDIVTLTLVDDLLVEDDERVDMTLDNPSSGTLVGTNDVHTVTIIDNDVAGTVSFSLAASEVSENAGTHAVQVELTVTDGVLPSPFTVSVAYGGTATSGGVDYAAGGALVTFNNGAGFAPGTYSQPISLAITDDDQDEDAETVVITLSNPSDSRVTPGQLMEHVVTITDNDRVGQHTSAGTKSGDEWAPDGSTGPDSATQEGSGMENGGLTGITTLPNTGYPPSN